MDSKRIQSQTRQRTVLCALLGSPIRHVSRLIGDQVLLVGKCYLHGSMDGEAWVQSETFFGNGSTIVTVPPGASAISSSTYSPNNNSPQEAVR